MKHTEAGDFLSVTPSELAPFRLARPADLEGVLRALAESPAPAVLHAGGTDLFARFRAGLAPATLISLGRVDALRATRIDAETIELGAGLSHRAALADPAVAALPGLREAWARIATVRIRHTGTLGGNLMARHTRYELSILLSALDARARLLGPAGGREIPVSALWDTDLTETPLLVSVAIPRAGDPRLDYERSQRPRFTQALCRRDGVGGSSWRLVMATEWLRPWIADFETATPPEAVMARLPESFSDTVVSRAYLARAGAAYLRRQRDRLEVTS